MFMFEMDIRGFFSLERGKKSLKRKGGKLESLAVEIMHILVFESPFLAVS